MKSNDENQNRPQAEAQELQPLLQLLASQLPPGDTLNDVMYA